MWRLLILVTPILALRMIEPPPPEVTNRNTPREGWLDVRLNQFDASNTETFKMRYYFNNEFAFSSHIVIFVGGEWSISPGWASQGLAYELARRTGAGLFYTEHRYYGLSRPTNDTSSSDLRYLNVDQALGDLAQFIQHVQSDDFENGRYKNGKVALVGCSYAGSMATWMRLAYPHLISAVFSDSGPLYAQEDFPGKKFLVFEENDDEKRKNDTSSSDLRYLNVDQALGDLAQFIQHVQSDDFENGRYKNGKVALVGCSYAGSMATWMRLAYPHLISAVFSDSGPLYAQEDFPEYVEVIAKAIKEQGGEACLSSIERGVQSIIEILDTPMGAERISQLFNTCSLLQASSPLDRATFFWYGITETFAYLVQFASPGDIPTACDAITNTTQDNSLERLAAWVTAHPWTQPCIESRYSEQVRIHTNLSYDAPGTNMRLWTYQTCVEYGWYQTTTGSKHPFLNTVPLGYFHQMCKDFFGIDFNESRLRSGIARTNNLFAGLNHIPDHVISVVGTHDPWSPMGPDASHGGYLAPVYVVDRISHCRAIRPTGTNETEQLEATKFKVLFHMSRWMTGDSMVAGATTTVLTPLLALAAICVAFFN